MIKCSLIFQSVRRQAGWMNPFCNVPTGPQVENNRLSDEELAKICREVLKTPLEWELIGDYKPEETLMPTIRKSQNIELAETSAPQKKQVDLLIKAHNPVKKKQPL